MASKSENCLWNHEAKSCSKNKAKISELKKKKKEAFMEANRIKVGFIHACNDKSVDRLDLSLQYPSLSRLQGNAKIKQKKYM